MGGIYLGGMVFVVDLIWVGRMAGKPGWSIVRELCV